VRHRDPRVRTGRGLRPAAPRVRQPIAEHQAIAFKLAEMATKVEAAHLMMVNAARLKDTGERNDVEAGMAKLIASEYCAEVTRSPSASTAATATPRNTRSSGSCARHRSC